jgi:DnaJ-class molecular chaperone
MFCLTILQQHFHKQVNEAYSVLSDPQKKARYDRGEDLDGNGFSTAGDKFKIFY